MRAHSWWRSSHWRANTRTRTSLNSRIGAEHANPRAKLRSTERDHVLANVLSNDLTVLRIGVRENVLNEIVAVLITRNVDQGNTRTIETTLADTLKIATEEVNATNLETFFDDLGRKLIHAVLRGISNDMINGTTTIGWSAMFADVLNAPIAELAVGDNINAGEDFLDARTLK